MPEPAHVDAYLVEELLAPDPGLDATLAANAEGGLPPIDVAPNQGKLLYLLASMARARTILEIGTLGGYSTTWLARALPTDGRLVTCEYEPKHAEVARANLDRAGVGDRVDIRVGAALDTLPTLAEDPAVPFDLVFVDADKPNNPRYLDWAVRLSRPGTVLVFDNVVRQGRVIDAVSAAGDVTGTRAMLHRLGSDPRLDATAIQTVGSKGWDGFALALGPLRQQVKERAAWRTTRRWARSRRSGTPSIGRKTSWPTRS